MMTYLLDFLHYIIPFFDVLGEERPLSVDGDDKSLHVFYNFSRFLANLGLEKKLREICSLVIENPSIRADLPEVFLQCS